MLCGRQSIPNDMSQSELDELKDISDIFIFDYLIDDHDRKLRKNWFIDEKGRYINLDSGLAWNHGPYGNEDCLEDILCDPSELWKAQDKKTKGENDKKFGPRKKVQLTENGSTFDSFIQEPCSLVCRFNKSTVSTLKKLTG